MARNHVIIVAAGSGSRFGGPVPKQFLPLDGRPVVMRTIENLMNAIPDAEFTLVLSSSEVDRWKALCEEYRFESPQIAIGGATRYDSVNNALSTVGEDAEIIWVHDGARPFPDCKMSSSILEAFDDIKVHGAIPAVPVTDSLRRINDKGSSTAVDRSKYVAVQTPQAFRAKLLLDAYRNAVNKNTFTDDASVMEAAGYNKLVLTPGSVNNIKITNPDDIDIAEIILRNSAKNR